MSTTPGEPQWSSVGRPGHRLSHRDRVPLGEDGRRVRLDDGNDELPHRAADAQFGLAYDLLTRLPAVYAAMDTGALDEQIEKLAIPLDPDWAGRRCEQALVDRKVVGTRNLDGSANLSGFNLPLDWVVAASEDIDALAKAAKHVGDPRPIGHIRADLFLGMTEGT